MNRLFFFFMALCAVQLSQGMESVEQQLIAAVVAGETDTVNRLLAEGADAKTRNPYGVPVLHLAVTHEREDVCRILIAHGADVNAQNNYGETALLIVGDDIEGSDMCKLLIAAGVDVNYVSPNGWTPLLIYSGRRPQTVRQLLAGGADCNVARKENKVTPLMYAAVFNSVSDCELLLQYGADPEMRDINGKSALSYRMIGPVAELLSDPAKISAVIRRADNPNLKKLRRFGPNICTALMFRELGRK